MLAWQVLDEGEACDCDLCVDHSVVASADYGHFVTGQYPVQADGVSRSVTYPFHPQLSIAMHLSILCYIPLGKCCCNTYNSMSNILSPAL